MDLEAAISYAKANRESALETFIEFLRIPSISTLAEYKEEVHAAANWVAAQMENCGLEGIKILPTDRHPIVYGEWLRAGQDAPTVLIYGHYDVQPVDPLQEWRSDPFEPRIVDQNIYARGASDMKSQVVEPLKAVEAIQRTSTLPVNIKYFIEGEEEIGSPSLETFVAENKELLACDLFLNCDAGMLEPETPSITYALRGLVYFQLDLQGPQSDLHSGRFGGVVQNPANILCSLIAGMHDAQGRVTLPGFYDRVRPLDDDQRAYIADLPATDEWWQEITGAPQLAGEAGFSATERAWARPTLDVNGLISGFTGEGSKTVIPARASAKLSMRLVPDQIPGEIRQALQQYLEANTPPTVTWELRELQWAAPPVIVERDIAAVRAARRALQAVWGKEPLFWRAGGTIALLGMVQELLGVNTLMLGFFLPDDNIHAPNEKYYLPNFYRGIEAYIRFIEEFAHTSAS